jgi:hypothetical protein
VILCGLAALEMVLRYYGANVSQLDFLKSDKRLKKSVEIENPQGLSESTLGILAIKRGLRVIFYGLSPRASRTFLKLGGKMVTRRADKQLILKILKLGIPPIVRISSTKVSIWKKPRNRCHTMWL